MKPISLLIIDDDEVDRLHLKRSLKTSGLDCVVTELDNSDTLEADLQKSPFDCIFLDYLLPGDNGLSLLQKIRLTGSSTPVVIITSQGSEQIAVELMKAGAADYIIKNQINSTSIGQIVRNILRTNQAEKDRAEAVSALRKSEARLAEAQRIARIGNWEVSDTNITYWSPEVYNIFELIEGECVPTMENVIRSIHPEDAASVTKNLRTAYSGGSFNTDYRLLTASGEKFVNIQGYGVIDHEGKFVRLLGTVQDITARKLAEQEILKARELAENSLKVREVFLANMSHEIRTPMNAIIGFTQLLFESRLSEEQKSFVDAINFSGENLLVIINDILDLSKMQSGKMTLERIDFNLNDLLHGITTSLRRKAQEKGLQLTFEMEAGVPHFVKGDPVRLNQVLTNLISNAIKFTARGYVHLQASARALADGKFSIHFAVRDTGIGIPKDKQADVFESFVQASSETTRKYGGTGLGLTIVKNIVALQEGSISLESMPGYGSTFHVQLPFEKADQEIAQIHNQEIADEEALHLLRRASILVVEDNHVNQLLVKRVLDKTGCKTEIVGNGVEAIEKVKTGKYDVVLMDIQMPEMDGYAATKFIRTNLPLPLAEIPIIAMTAHALTSEVEKCISIGMNDYISKPFKQEVLFSKIIKLLKKSDHRHHTAPPAGACRAVVHQP